MALKGVEGPNTLAFLKLLIAIISVVNAIAGAANGVAERTGVVDLRASV